MTHSVQAFEIAFILDPFCTNTLINLVKFFTNRRIYEAKFPTHVSFLSSIFYSLITSHFPSTIKPFLLFVPVHTLSRYSLPLTVPV